MKIESVHIEGFGIWHDRTWGPLAPGLNVFHGPNETGKSTLMSFLRAIFFGLDRRGQARRYEPLRGGMHGGWLDVSVEGRSIRIERKAGRHVRGAVSVYDGAATGTEPDLEKLLGGMTRTLYHNVFAFGLEELEQFHTLQDSEVAQHISGAALGIGAARWSAVQKDLESRQNTLYLQRGQSSVINVALKELEGIRDDLDRTEHQPEEYWSAHEARTRLAAEVEGLEAAVSDLKQRASQYEKRLKIRPMIERRKAIQAKLQALHAPEAFPEGGVERLELLQQQFRRQDDERLALRKEAERARFRRMELRPLVDSGDLAFRAETIEVLRSLLPRMDAAGRVYGAAVEARHAVEQEKSAIEAAIASVRPPSYGAFVAFIFLIVSGGLAFWWLGHPEIAGPIFAVTLPCWLWYRRKGKTFGSLRAQLDASASRLESCSAEVSKIEREARGIESQLQVLTGKPEIALEDIESRAAELEHLQKASEEMARLAETLERIDAETARLTEQIEETQDAGNALLLEGGAADGIQFLERAEAFKLRQQLLAELDRIPEEPPEPGLLFDIRVNEEEALKAVRSELADMEQRLIAARHESGRVDERIASMERSVERSRALLRQEVVLARIDTSAEMWAVVTLCRTLLDETRKIYETDRQPEVLRQASFFFDVMTEGRYRRVIAPLDGPELEVERADGVRLAPASLSRGTAEQLYLAMRLALVRDYAQHTEPLPLVFDDVFVNFDPERTRHTFSAVREIAKTHQVLLFTCHPHVAALADEIVPDARTFPLQ